MENETSVNISMVGNHEYVIPILCPKCGGNIGRYTEDHSIVDDNGIKLYSHRTSRMECDKCHTEYSMLDINSEGLLKMTITEVGGF